MSQKSSAPPARVPAEKLVRDIRRTTRKHHSAEDKTRISPSSNALTPN
jgi:transposase